MKTSLLIAAFLILASAAAAQTQRAASASSPAASASAHAPSGPLTSQPAPPPAKANPGSSHGGHSFANSTFADCCCISGVTIDQPESGIDSFFAEGPTPNTYTYAVNDGPYIPSRFVDFDRAVAAAKAARDKQSTVSGTDDRPNSH